MRCPPAVRPPRWAGTPPRSTRNSLPITVIKTSARSSRRCVDLAPNVDLWWEIGRFVPTTRRWTRPGISSEVTRVAAQRLNRRRQVLRFGVGHPEIGEHLLVERDGGVLDR